MHTALIIVWASLVLGQASPSCVDVEDCYGCAQSCHWCPRDNHCHSAVWVNFMDPCFFHGDDIRAAQECPDQPSKPAQLPANSTFAKDVLKFLFKGLGISDVNVDACVSDIGHSEVRFRDFAIDLKNKSYAGAVEHLQRALSALANSVTTCGVPEVQQKIDTLAAAVKWANISTAGFDKGVKAIVGASDLWLDLEAVEKAADSKSPGSVGDALNKLLDDWTTIEGGCKSGQKVCQVLDGLLRVVAATAKDVTPCEHALTPAITSFEQGVQLFKAKHYQNATAKFASGLDFMAAATSSDACGLQHIANAVGNLSPKLADAIVKIENSTAVKIIVGSADLYDVLYVLVQDYEKKDYTGVGVQLGLLLAKLNASGCKTEMCTVLQGLLASFQVSFTNFEACSSELDKTWAKMQELVTSLENKQWKTSLLALGDLLKDLSDDFDACGVKSIGSILQNTASKFHADSLAIDIGVAMQILVEGADITPDIQKIIVDSTNKQWAALGSDLGTLSTWIGSTHCHSFVCQLMEGILNEADMALTNLKPCEDTLRLAENDFITGSQLWGKYQHKSALNYWASGLNQLAKAVEACDLPDELKYLEQEANVLQLGNVTSINSTIGILVHGSDIYQEVYGAWQAFAQKDYRTAGSELQKAVLGMYQWTTGHLCTSNGCYVFSGMLQYLSDLAGDFKTCRVDLQDMMDKFGDAVHQITSHSYTKASSLFGFSRNMTAIKEGIRDLGKGINDLARSVSDCHLEELIHLLTKLAAKLGIAPHLEIVEEILRILINGVDIEQEVADACEDFSESNWPGFGYNLIKIIKFLLTDEESSKFANTSAAVIVI